MFIFIIDFIRTYLTQISLFQIPNYIIIKISFLSNLKKQSQQIIQVKKVNILIDNSELLNLNLYPSLYFKFKIQQKASSLILPSSIKEKQSYYIISLASQQSSSRISLLVDQQIQKGKKYHLEQIRSIPTYSTDSIIFIIKIAFNSLIKVCESIDITLKIIYNQKNNTGFQNNQKLNSVQNIRNVYKLESLLGLKSIYLNQQSQKKIIIQIVYLNNSKIAQEYTKQLIKQLPKFLDIDNEKFYDNQQKFLTEYEFGLNISQIQEINEDVLSSNSLSTFYNKVF
ncbi:unnamed protein product [Paramecium primaurelia]|uniref:Uncharacterized protein n=1 Tax=Paramecium primaurelia TaxID=5886 RepID=A0A8S1NCQ8_PARPR|nr:unnamed protein product [Paramecium primaurelia]